MVSKLVHPNLMSHLAETHYNSTVTIQSATTTYNSTNEPVLSWSDDTSLNLISAYIEPIENTQENRQAQQTVVMNLWAIELAGYYPTIDNEQRVLDNQGRIFTILTVGTDDTNTLTVLICEMVNPSVSAPT